MLKRVHVIIYGDVTGVGFRMWILKQVKNKQLTGFVQNVGSGVVELIAEGAEEKLKKLVTLCKKGPEVSWVEKVKVEWGKATNEFMSFKIK